MEPPICAVAEPVKGVEKGSPREAGPGELHGKTVYFTALCPAWQIFSEKRLFLSVFPTGPAGFPPGPFYPLSLFRGQKRPICPVFPPAELLAEIGQFWGPSPTDFL